MALITIRFQSYFCTFSHQKWYYPQIFVPHFDIQEITLTFQNGG